MRLEREYSVPQVAAILGLSQQQVSNALERDLKALGVAKLGRGVRTVSSEGLIALELQRAFADLFQPRLRLRLIEAALRTPARERICVDNVVVYIAEYMKKIRRQKSRLQEAEGLVVCNREVLSGEPCIKGTRVPIYSIGALARGHGAAEAHRAYPFIPKETIELVSLYVAAYPRRGRPPETALPPPEAPARRGKTRKVAVTG